MVSREQAETTGLRRNEIEHRLRTGRFIQLHRAVFAVGYRPVTRRGEWRAALLATGDDAAISHATAAALWGMLPELGDEIHVTVPEVQRRPHHGVRPHRNRLGKEEITVHLDLRVTTPLRTLIDLAATPTTGAQIERAIRQAEYDHLTTAALLGEAVANLDGRRGVRKLRNALAKISEAPGMTRSKLERRFLNFLRRSALPRPKLNIAMKVGGRRIEVDCLWPRQRVIVELDGRAAHTTSAAFESDRARDAALTAAGYRVVRITWRRLHDEPAALAAELRKILTESDEERAIRAKRHFRRAA